MKYRYSNGALILRFFNSAMFLFLSWYFYNNGMDLWIVGLEIIFGIFLGWVAFENLINGQIQIENSTIKKFGIGARKFRLNEIKSIQNLKEQIIILSADKRIIIPKKTMRKDDLQKLEDYLSKIKINN